MYLGDLLTDYNPDTIFKTTTTIVPASIADKSWSMIPAVNKPAPLYNFGATVAPKIVATSIFEPQAAPAMMPISRSSTNAYSVVGQDMRTLPEPLTIPPRATGLMRIFEEVSPNVVIGGAGAAMILIGLLLTRGNK